MPCVLVRLCARGVLELHERSRVIDNGYDMKQSKKIMETRARARAQSCIPQYLQSCYQGNKYCLEEDGL